MSAPTELTLRGTADTIVSSGSSLSNNTAVLESAYNPTSAGYAFFQFILTMAFGTSPTAGTALSMWLLLEDGSGNYESGSATGPILPARNPDLVLPVIAQTASQTISRYCPAPPGPCKPFIYNNGTGQSVSSAWSLICVPFTYKAPTQ